MGDLREPIVGATEERPVLSSPSSSNPNPSSIAAARWERAESATQEIIRQVQPTAVSEERRRKVIDYVQRLIKGRIGCEVFPFGSVPLKTYLPDGDIDMTAFGGASVEDALVNDVVSVLEAEDQNEAAEFVVMDVQLIRAEVKLVKCIIQNIVVDISFNQLGGLCTLCFLEQVDRLIGKHHMFKNSIILIKAWCYYESRILGAHHGLISTYALETLVLYIFHLFHSSLHGPLAVLYWFLDYFSKFDWDNYCISLTGPVRITSLPEIVAEKPEIGGHDLLLSNDFLRYCVDMFSVPSRGAEINSRTFPQKHLNIVDPLKESNNLGRSVSKGNFYRIRSAFTYGARKLGQILLQPDDNIAGELHKFFSNTLDRHGSGQRPDVQDPIPMVSQNGFVPAFFFSETDSCREEKGITELKSVNSVLINGACKLDPDGPSHNGGNYIEVSGMEMKNVTTVNGHQRGSPKVVSSTSLAETNGSVSRITTDMEYRFSGDAEDLATSTMQGLQISNDKPKAFPPNAEVTMSLRRIARYAPHLYFSGSITGNGKLECGTTDVKELEYSGSTADRVSPRLLPVQDESTGVFVGHGMEKNLSVGYHEVMNTMGSKDVSCSTTGFNPGYREKNSMGAAACSPEFVKSLSDLSGDFDRHLNSLHYGRWCFENSSNVPAFPLPPALPSQFQCKSSWDMVRHSYQMNRNGFSNVNANSVMPRPAFYRMNTMVIPGATFGMEELPKPRGIGTYFPIVNRPPFEKPLAGRGRNQGPVRSPRNNGQPTSPLEANFVARSSGELSQAQFSDQVNGTSGPSDFHEASSPGEKLPGDVNGLLLKSERLVEMGTVGCVPFGLPLSEHSRQPNHDSRLTQTSTESVPTLTMQKQNPLMGINQDRIRAKSSYRLKDEDDFPPLSI